MRDSPLHSPAETLPPTAPTALDRFARDVARGLARSPKSLPSMYFYDARGARLFQHITELEEYYPTRCELEILETHAAQIAATAAGGPLRLVELGAGDGRKTEILLRELLHRGLDFEYVPIDICRATILALTDSLHLRTGNPRLRIRGIVAEYFDGLAALDHQPGRNLVLFLGSNIGNLSPRRAARFLRRLRRALAPGDFALLGFDLKKDLDVLQRAYDDPSGVTAEFNLNLLDRINRELGGRFDRSRFRHHALYNPRRTCMESWLVSLAEQQVPIESLGRQFRFAAWEGIHTESSCKYDPPQIEALAAAAGFQVRRHFPDRRHWFLDSLWQVP